MYLVATLTVLKFPTAQGAETMLNTLENLQKQQLIQIEDGAIVTWPEGAKKPKSKRTSYVRISQSSALPADLVAGGMVRYCLASPCVSPHRCTLHTHMRIQNSKLFSLARTPWKTLLNSLGRSGQYLSKMVSDKRGDTLNRKRLSYLTRYQETSQNEKGNDQAEGNLPCTCRIERFRTR